MKKNIHSTPLNCVLCRPQYLQIKTAINKFQAKNIKNQPVVDIALDQHKELENLLKSVGTKVEFVEPQINMHYQVFVRDIFVGEISPIIVCNPLKDKRRIEVVEIKKLLASQNKEYKEIEGAFLEGGDVIINNNRIFVAIGDRTNEKGVEWISNNYSENYLIQPIKIRPGFLHLDMVFNVISEESCVLFQDAIYPSSLSDIENIFSNVIRITEQEYEYMSSNFLIVGDQFISSVNCSSIVLKEAEKNNYVINQIPFNEIQKAGGGIRCATNFF